MKFKIIFVFMIAVAILLAGGSEKDLVGNLAPGMAYAQVKQLDEETEKAREEEQKGEKIFFKSEEEKEKEKEKEDLNQEGKIISVWYGSSIKDIIKKEFPLATIKEFKFPWIEVQEGRADACLTDSVTKVFLQKHPGLKLMRDKEGKLIIFSREYAQPGIKPGEQRFLSWINNWYQYYEAQGTINYWCNTWWESFMADRS
mgnify:CR=1 FL=1